MTAALAPPRVRRRIRLAAPGARRAADGAVPALDRRLHVVRGSLLMLGGTAMCLLLHLLLVSPLQQRADQQQAYDALRGALAAGTAPTSAADLDAALGEPVAYLEIPAIGLRQVVLEGTTSGTLATGPGHRRDTAFPGLAGTSVVMGRSALFGGPFGRIAKLDEGDVVTVTTGAGVVEYRVIGVRRSGEPVPPPLKAGGGRLVMVTSDGGALVPSGVVLVDAELAVPPLGAARPAVAAGALPANERPMATDSSTLWRLVLWLQPLLAIVLGGVWVWHRWGRARAWLICAPPLLLTGLMTAGELTRLLPNLL